MYYRKDESDSEGWTTLHFSVREGLCFSDTEVKDGSLLLRRYNQFVYLFYEDMFGFLFYFEIWQLAWDTKNEKPRGETM
jgi:hypothetical protein